MNCAYKEKRAASEMKTIPRKKGSDRAPMSFAQERLWSLDQLEPDSCRLQHSDGATIRGALNVPVLQRCLNEVLRRHKSLRTRFETVEGQPVRVIQPTASLEMPLMDLRGLQNRSAKRRPAIVRGRGATPF